MELCVRVCFRLRWRYTTNWFDRALNTVSQCLVLLLLLLWIGVETISAVTPLNEVISFWIKQRSLTQNNSYIYNTYSILFWCIAGRPIFMWLFDLENDTTISIRKFFGVLGLGFCLINLKWFPCLLGLNSLYKQTRNGSMILCQLYVQSKTFVGLVMVVVVVFFFLVYLYLFGNRVKIFLRLLFDEFSIYILSMFWWVFGAPFKLATQTARVVWNHIHSIVGFEWYMALWVCS